MPPPTKRDTLRGLTLGQPTAEEEKDLLSSYFVETEFWRRILRDELDVIYGPKGAGKSAIYVLVSENMNSLFDRRILLVTAENVRGAAVFKSLVADPPASERDFVYLWKLYFIALIGRVLVEYDMITDVSKRYAAILREENLLPSPQSTLASIFKIVTDYLKLPKITGLEGAVGLDPNSGLANSISGKILFGEPDQAQRQKGAISVDEVLGAWNAELERSGYTVWLLLDRLDVAFEDNDALEENALRALFKVYLDLRAFDRIRTKIFLRSDIWNRITKKGFREASHLNRGETLSWNKKALLNVVIRRLLSDQNLREHYQVDSNDVLSSETSQEELFYRVFPEKVDPGAKKPSTLDWILSRTRDGTGRNAPREIIILLNAVVAEELSRLDRGGDEVEGEILCERSSFKAALPTVSDHRLSRTLYAEHPALRPYIEKLRDGKSEFALDDLTQNWKVGPDEAALICDALTEAGFFEKRGEKGKESYWVPFIFRPALGLTMGRASADEEE